MLHSINAKKYDQPRKQAGSLAVRQAALKGITGQGNMPSWLRIYVSLKLFFVRTAIWLAVCPSSDCGCQSSVNCKLEDDYFPKSFPKTVAQIGRQ